MRSTPSSVENAGWLTCFRLENKNVKPYVTAFLTVRKRENSEKITAGFNTRLWNTCVEVEPASQ